MNKFRVATDLHGNTAVWYKDMLVWSFSDPSELDDLVFVLTSHQADQLVLKEESE